MMGRPVIKRLSSERGLTLMEMVVAITIIMIIMVGVVWSFVELLDSHDKARARMEATANARHALEVMSSEFKRARNGTSRFGPFAGQTISVAGGGDRFDDDGDGDFDEEIFNGADDEGTWVRATHDKHVALAPASETQYYVERPVFFGYPDLGDGDVDEDIGATSATVQFPTFDVPGDPLSRYVRLYLGYDPDGRPHTLMREIRGVDPVTSQVVVTSGPLCYNVHSFGVLYWNHAMASDSGANPWEMNWPPVAPRPRPTVAPSSVYIRLKVYAGKPYDLDEVPVTEVIETVSLDTVVNIEAVMAHPTYVSQRTPILPVTAPAP